MHMSKLPNIVNTTAFKRHLFGMRLLNGSSSALGLLLVSLLIFFLWGKPAASNAAAGCLLALLPDQARPRRGKMVHLTIAPVLGLPSFLVVQLLRQDVLLLGIFLMAVTFLAFLIMAWGRRAIPIAAAIMLITLLAMAPDPAQNTQEALVRTFYCALGSVFYIVYGTISGAVLNLRYRKQAMAELLYSLSQLLALHAKRLQRYGQGASAPDPLNLQTQLKRQASLADQTQPARDIILEAPRTTQRRRLAGMLILALEIRDRLIINDLDFDRIPCGDHDELLQLSDIVNTLSLELANIADALLTGRNISVCKNHQQELTDLRLQTRQAARDAPDNQDLREWAALIRSFTVRFGHQDAAIHKLSRLARGELAADLSAVRNSWQLFVSPAYWSIKPLLSLWHWREPALRLALRATLAMGAAYAITVYLPWGTRDYWVLMTVVFVLRSNLAQTLARRNQRIIGTLVGSAIALALLSLQPSLLVMLLIVTVSLALGQTFIASHYTTASATSAILGLILAHLLHAVSNPAFAFVERVVDTILGAVLAWAFSYVLPSWERDHIQTKIQRLCRAMARHAQQSLHMAALTEVSAQPELSWRLARREAYDALSALVEATDRSRFEPRAVQPPQQILQKLQGHGYQLLGQLSAVQSILLLRRDQLELARVVPQVSQSAKKIAEILDLQQSPEYFLNKKPVSEDKLQAQSRRLPAVPEALPNLFDASPELWLKRRLRLSTRLAARVRTDADLVLQQLQTRTPDNLTTAEQAEQQEEKPDTGRVQDGLEAGQ